MVLSRLLWIVLALIGMVCGSVPGDDAGRLRWLESARRKHDVFTMSAQDLVGLVYGASRPFEMVVVLSTDGCEACQAMENSLKQVVAEYYKSGVRSEKPAFFAVVKLSQESQQFLQDSGIRSVPILYHIESSLKYPRKIAQPGDRNAHTMKDQESFSSSTIKLFLNSRIQSGFRVRRTGPVPISLTQLLPIVIGVGGGLLVAASLMYRLYEKAMFWFAICLLIYAFGVSGLYFVVHHGSPFAMMEDDGLHLISPGSRQQYAVEGFLAAFLYILTGGVLILAPELPRKFSAPSSQVLASVTVVATLVFLSRALYTMFLIKYPYLGNYQY